MKFIDNNISQMLGQAMDAYTLRQRVTASNIANIDTEGYKRHEVRFEKELAKAQQSEGAGATKQVNPSIVETGQEVVLEDELTEMSDTQIRVHLVTRALRHQFDLLRTGITGINR